MTNKSGTFNDLRGSEGDILIMAQITYRRYIVLNTGLKF